jgi:hypothetical protein
MLHASRRRSPAPCWRQRPREELFPSPIDVAPMQYGDLVAFIGKYPHRLTELTSIVLGHQRGELVGMLERAANEHGYVYKDRAFVRPVAAEVEPQLLEAIAAGDDAAADANALAEQLDEVEAAKPVVKTTAAKSMKPKSTPAPAAKDAKKAAPAKSAGKASKKATVAAADDLPWPFPKSSTQPRDGATLDKPAQETVEA